MKQIFTFLLFPVFLHAQQVDTIIDAGIYKSYYSYEVKGPLYVIYTLYKGGGDCPRSGMSFKTVGLRAEAGPKNYKASGFDEGHLCNAKDFARICADEEKTFRFYNALPQTPKLNRSVWKVYETLIRKESQSDSLLIMCGGEFKNCTYIGQDVAVPTYCWKIVRRVTDDKVIHILWFPNDDSNKVEELKTVEELVSRLTYKVK